MSVKTIFAPASIKAIECSMPKRPDAPVTRAVLLDRLKFSKFILRSGLASVSYHNFSSYVRSEWRRQEGS